MAIAPIQTTSNLNPLERILNSGGQAITQILNQATQQARDSVNNQFRQDETNVRNMQLAQGLSQRRAQDLDQRLIDTRNFNYRQDQDALNLDLRREQMGLTRDQQLFNRGMDEQRFGFTQEQAAITNAQRQQGLDQNAQLREDTLNASVADRNTRNAFSAAELDLKQREASREEALFNQFGTTKPPTRADQRAERGLELREETNQRNQIGRQNEVDVADVSAFPIPDSEAQRRLAATIAGGTPEAEALAALSEADRQAITEADNLKSVDARLNRELAAIQNYDNEAAFVAAGGTNLSDAAKRRRAEFYRRNKGQGVVTSPQQGFSFGSLIDTLSR